MAAGSNNDWIFRWQDPIGSNWISLLESDIASGNIIVNAPNGYQVYDQNGFTYIGAFSAAAVPEPSSLVLMVLGLAGALFGIQSVKRTQVFTKQQ